MTLKLEVSLNIGKAQGKAISTAGKKSGSPQDISYRELEGNHVKPKNVLMKISYSFALEATSGRSTRTTTLLLHICCRGITAKAVELINKVHHRVATYDVCLL